MADPALVYLAMSRSNMISRSAGGMGSFIATGAWELETAATSRTNTGVPTRSESSKATWTNR
jgi:hypothetical protein